MIRRKLLAVVRWPVGGIRTYLRYVYPRLSEDGYELTILAPRTLEMEVLMNTLAGPDIRYIPVDGQHGFKFPLAVLRAMAAEKYHLVHSHGFTAGMTVAPMARLRRLPHVMTSHDVFTSRQFHGLSGRLRRFILASGLPRIDVIQSVSRDAETNLLEYFPGLGKRRDRLVTIPNGILVDRFVNAEPRDFRGELGLTPDHFIVGFLGRFMSQKGFTYLIGAIERLRGIEGIKKIPVVLAVGSGGFLGEEKKIIERKGLGSHFRFLPFEENVAATLKGLDVLAVPSLWEACPLLPMEAMVAGTPVIGTDCVGLREVLRGTPSTVIPPGDAGALASALQARMDNPGRSEAVAFVEQARRRFDAGETARRLSELFDTLTSHA
jgi:glycosyltransferase involved in cell wall biosynthesis